MMVWPGVTPPVYWNITNVGILERYAHSTGGCTKIKYIKRDKNHTRKTEVGFTLKCKYIPHYVNICNYLLVKNPYTNNSRGKHGK